MLKGVVIWVLVSPEITRLAGLFGSVWYRENGPASVPIVVPVIVTVIGICLYLI
jgi:hypothetical protein